MSLDNPTKSAPFEKLTTKAFVVEKASAPFVLQDIILDDLGANELLVEIKYAGICHTVRVLFVA